MNYLKSKYDLHVHTTISDGKYTPQEIVEKAKGRGLELIAITDHGKIEGAKQIINSSPRGIEIIPGIEFTAGISNDLFHILGYFKGLPDLDFDFHQPMDFVREREIYARIKRRIGRSVPIWREEIQQAKGVIKEIKENDGIAVLAHPSVLRLHTYKLDKLVERLVNFGLDGIEIYNGKYPEGDTEIFKELADKYNLIKTSGTDYHGYFNEIGENMMDEFYLKEFLEKFGVFEETTPQLPFF